MALPPTVTEPLVFPQTIEALFIRGLKGRFDETAKSRLRRLGLDIDRPLRPAYPAEVLVHATELAARSCFPGKPLTEAYFLLGQYTVLGMEETFVGKAQVAFARLIGPMRALLGIPKALKGASNYTTGTAKQEGPTTAVLDISGYKIPYAQFEEGNLTAVVSICGGREPVVQTLRFDPSAEQISVRVSWK